MIFPGTYDVQSVNISAIPGGLELSCTFVNGSQAQSCLLTVCRVEDDNAVEGLCISITIRNTYMFTSTKQINNLQLGKYTITHVTTTSGGEVNTVRGIELDVLQVRITDLVTSPSMATMSSSTPGYNDYYIDNKVTFLPTVAV